MTTQESQTPSRCDRCKQKPQEGHGLTKQAYADISRTVDIYLCQECSEHFVQNWAFNTLGRFPYQQEMRRLTASLPPSRDHHNRPTETHGIATCEALPLKRTNPQDLTQPENQLRWTKSGSGPTLLHRYMNPPYYAVVSRNPQEGTWTGAVYPDHLTHILTWIEPLFLSTGNLKSKSAKTTVTTWIETRQQARTWLREWAQPPTGPNINNPATPADPEHVSELVLKLLERDPA